MYAIGGTRERDLPGSTCLRAIEGEAGGGNCGAGAGGIKQGLGEGLSW